MTFSDSEDLECPLCMEEIDLSDRYFKPCPCGYQICRFCWNHIMTDLNAKCPACRRVYDKDNIEFRPVPAEELARIKSKKKRKERERKEQDQQSKRHLANARIVQKNLVYVLGLPNKVCNEDALRTQEYFGQFGKIIRVMVNKRGHAHVPIAMSQLPSNNTGVYITYARKEDATKAIESVDGSLYDQKTIRATYGTTKYCTYYLKGQQCQNPGCSFLHEPGEEADLFAKEEMTRMQSREKTPKVPPFPSANGINIQLSQALNHAISANGNSNSTNNSTPNTPTSAATTPVVGGIASAIAAATAAAAATSKPSNNGAGSVNSTPTVGDIPGANGEESSALPATASWANKLSSSGSARQSTTSIADFLAASTTPSGNGNSKDNGKQSGHGSTPSISSMIANETNGSSNDQIVPENRDSRARSRSASHTNGEAAGGDYANRARLSSVQKKSGAANGNETNGTRSKSVASNFTDSMDYVDAESGYKSRRGSSRGSGSGDVEGRGGEHGDNEDDNYNQDGLDAEASTINREDDDMVALGSAALRDEGDENIPYLDVKSGISKQGSQNNMNTHLASNGSNGGAIGGDVTVTTNGNSGSRSYMRSTTLLNAPYYSYTGFFDDLDGGSDADVSSYMLRLSPLSLGFNMQPKYAGPFDPFRENPLEPLLGPTDASAPTS